MKTVDERYQVRKAEIERALRTLAALIDEHMPEGWALFLEHAPEGQGAVFWISNAERDGMIEAVKGWIEDYERRSRNGAAARRRRDGHS